MAGSAETVARICAAATAEEAAAILDEAAAAAIGDTGSGLPMDTGRNGVLSPHPAQAPTPVPPVSPRLHPASLLRHVYVEASSRLLRSRTSKATGISQWTYATLFVMSSRPSVVPRPSSRPR